MSVEHAVGDLLDFTDWNVAAHCANCTNTFGSGIAKSIRERYPVAYEADRLAYEAGEAQLGLLSYADVADGKKVVNLYGQFNYGLDKRQLNYEGFYTALSTLESLLADAHKEGRIYTLGLPHLIGCFRAGGKWEIVLCMIESLFGSSPVRCVIVQLPS